MLLIHITIHGMQSVFHQEMPVCSTKAHNLIIGRHNMPFPILASLKFLPHLITDHSLVIEKKKQKKRMILKNGAKTRKFKTVSVRSLSSIFFPHLWLVLFPPTPSVSETILIFLDLFLRVSTHTYKYMLFLLFLLFKQNMHLIHTVLFLSFALFFPPNNILGIFTCKELNLTIRFLKNKNFYQF